MREAGVANVVEDDRPADGVVLEVRRGPSRAHGHRGPSKPRTVRRPDELVATGPNEVWSWDITYLPATVRGMFFYLYLFVDVWSRRIMKAVVLGEESAEHAARLLAEACAEHQVQPQILTLHSDNGSPMKGATMLATMQVLGVVASFSRPSVSNDNPYSESLFRTLKYVPSYPRKPFESIDSAWAWVERFVDWYNGEHRHSAIGFVTPDERHRGHDVSVLLARRDVYAAARRRHPARWESTPETLERAGHRVPQPSRSSDHRSGGGGAPHRSGSDDEHGAGVRDEDVDHAASAPRRIGAFSMNFWRQLS